MTRTTKRIFEWSILTIACLLFYLLLSCKNQWNMQDPKPKERVQQKVRELAIQEKLEVYEALKSMKARADIVSDLCQTDIKYQTDSGICWGSSRSRTLLSTKDKSLMYTPIPKCGWTTWMVVFFDHYKVYHDGNTGWAWNAPYDKINFKITSLECSKEFLDYEYRLLFVRNPYERLVSGYKNKVLEKNGLYVKTYNKPCPWLTLDPKYNQTSLTFSQFVSCILETARGQSADLSSRKAGILLDHHWAPQVHLSLPCTAMYTHIGTYDHFADDANEMIRIHKINATLKRINQTPKSLSRSLESWYKQLSVEQLVGLQQLYKYDFELFGYDPSPPL